MANPCTNLKKCQTMTRQFTQEIVQKSTRDWTPCETCPMRQRGGEKQRETGQPAFMRKVVGK